MDILTTEEALEKIFNFKYQNMNPEKRRFLAIYKHRYYKNQLSTKGKERLLEAFGYEVVSEKKWIKKN